MKDFIYSDSSGEEELDDGSTRQVKNVKQLPWRGEKALHFFRRLDRLAKNEQLEQSIAQRMARVVGSDSLRPKPAKSFQ